jgi:hypothetical protein
MSCMSSTITDVRVRRVAGLLIVPTVDEFLLESELPFSLLLAVNGIQLCVCVGIGLVEV